uniref:Secreted protein n=1 Tax=Syphacia muris TaxID=451379 RepID=A0A0N5B1K7_9BILA
AGFSSRFTSGTAISGITISGITISGITISGILISGITISGILISGITISGITISGILISGTFIATSSKARAMASGKSNTASSTSATRGNTEATAALIISGRASVRSPTMMPGKVITTSVSSSKPGSTIDSPSASAISPGSVFIAFPMERTDARIFPSVEDRSPTAAEIFPIVACILLIASRVSFPCWMISSWFFS